MYRYEVAFPIVGIGYYYLDSEEELSELDALEKAWDNIQKNDTIDEYNWEVFLRESDASPFPEAAVIESWKENE
jgi:hypothetical protein